LLNLKSGFTPFSTLPLLMLFILAVDAHNTPALDDLAVTAHLLD